MSKLNKLAGLLVAPMLLIGASAAVSAEEVGQTLRFPVSSLVRLPLETSSLAKAESGSSQNAQA